MSKTEKAGICMMVAAVLLMILYTGGAEYDLSTMWLSIGAFVTGSTLFQMG